MPRTATSTVDARLVGAGIRAARSKQNLTQAALANRLQVSTAYVQKIESGRANPTLGQLANIARALTSSLRVEFVPAAETPSDPLAAFAEL
jgi:transcriptional regulator with XRE-family HTH domain